MAYKLLFSVLVAGLAITASAQGGLLGLGGLTGGSVPGHGEVGGQLPGLGGVTGLIGNFGNLGDMLDVPQLLALIDPLGTLIHDIVLIIVDLGNILDGQMTVPKGVEAVLNQVVKILADVVIILAGILLQLILRLLLALVLTGLVSGLPLVGGILGGGLPNLPIQLPLRGLGL